MLLRWAGRMPSIYATGALALCAECVAHKAICMIPIPTNELSTLLPCGHYIAQSELLRLAASIMGSRGKGKSGGARKGSGRKPKVAHCPKCGLQMTATKMRTHAPKCLGF